MLSRHEALHTNGTTQCRRRIKVTSRDVTVLVIDDDPEVQKALCSILSSAGFVPKAAEGGKIGLEMLDQGPLPGAVILDLQMPELRGEKVLGVIRAKYPALVVIIGRII